LELRGLKFAVAKIEKLISENGDRSGTQTKGDVDCWKPLLSKSYWRLRENSCTLELTMISRRIVSSGMLRRVALVRSDVSEEPGNSDYKET
jgi:hypothetical protein